MISTVIYISFIFLSGLILFLLVRWSFCFIVHKKAISILEKKYFPEGTKSKKEFIDKLNTITNNKYSQKELTDYYLKIRGLQNFNKDGINNFWIRFYLRRQPFIKLTYYEQQTLFNEILKNHNNNIITADSNERKSTFPRLENGVFAY